ncbi:MAG: TIGR03936 family radical SAM-associated protein [Clostridia bacterium]|nr:TIGR03936 family radical SAM-associated protein [Clostridia bacterium]
MSRYRVCLSVEGRARWLSHLDLLSALERALRRTGLPVTYSQGFNPHMQISWGPAHPVGLLSDGEYLDLFFTEEPPINWTESLNKQLPADLHIIKAKPVTENAAAPMAEINLACYRLQVSGIAPGELRKNAAALMASEEYLFKRVSPKKSKILDIRPGIKKLEVEDNVIYCELTLGEGNSPKPRELAQIIAPGAVLCQMRRTALLVDDGQARREP